MKQNVILLEFNELSPTLMNRFINQGHLPNFKRFSEESAIYLTEAAERAPYLDPWIQWVTVHTGLDFNEHHIERLNEGHTLDAKRSLGPRRRTGTACLDLRQHERRVSAGIEAPSCRTRGRRTFRQRRRS